MKTKIALIGAILIMILSACGAAATPMAAVQAPAPAAPAPVVNAYGANTSEQAGAPAGGSTLGSVVSDDNDKRFGKLASQVH